VERCTVLDCCGISDLASDDRLVVDFLNHSSRSGSQHWILEFSGKQPGVVSISTAGPRVVREMRLVDVSADELRQLDEMFRATPKWGAGAATYCDIRLRQFHGEDLVAEETRLCVTPFPAEGCTLLMNLCQALPPTRDARTFSSQLSEVLLESLFTVLRGVPVAVSIRR
jgi:hypothetical protein